MDLSQLSGASVNDFIDKADYSMTYCSVDDAIRYVWEVGKGALIAKLDVKHTFRLIPVRPEDRHLLGFGFQENFYFDVVLPFGCHSFL